MNDTSYFSVPIRQQNTPRHFSLTVSFRDFFTPAPIKMASNSFDRLNSRLQKPVQGLETLHGFAMQSHPGLPSGFKPWICISAYGCERCFTCCTGGHVYMGTEKPNTVFQTDF